MEKKMKKKETSENTDDTERKMRTALDHFGAGYR
jgi:hypothetical protein